MIESDTKAFWDADAKEHMAFANQYGRNPAVRYPMYEIRRDHVLKLMESLEKGRVLDGGCGAGQMIAAFLNRGWDAEGFDFSEPMVELAHNFLREEGHDPNRVRVGRMNDLSVYRSESFDLVTVLGVSQYIRSEDDSATWAELQRVLKPGGRVIIDFVNALFDLSTFNRFTVRFVVDEFVRRFFSSDRIPELEKRIAALLTNPHKPDAFGRYATRRDLVVKRTENPLTVAERMRGFGFEQRDALFYRYHAVPPLLFESEPELEKNAICMENELARHWIGHFTASAFISVLVKC